MTTIEFEKRLTHVERELAELKAKVMPTEGPNAWIEKIAGTFSSPDARAAFDEAMGYGRALRKGRRSAGGKRRAARR